MKIEEVLKVMYDVNIYQNPEDIYGYINTQNKTILSNILNKFGNIIDKMPYCKTKEISKAFYYFLEQYNIENKECSEYYKNIVYSIVTNKNKLFLVRLRKDIKFNDINITSCIVSARKYDQAIEIAKTYNKEYTWPENFEPLYVEIIGTTFFNTCGIVTDTIGKYTKN